MFTISHLHAGTNNQTILHDLNLTIQPGEITAIMGPNGSGKTTLAAIIAGHPSYQVQEGTILFGDQDILVMAPEERATEGIFLAFQYPPSLPGVSVSHFLRLSLNAQEKARGETLTAMGPFIKRLRTTMAQLQIPWSFAERSLNDGFSGGEKKRMEMLQMLILQPRLVILDEIDSGLDIDAMRIVSQAVQSLDLSRTSILIITHYQRLLEYLQPHTVHVLKEGHIVRSGTSALAKELENSGYADF